MNFNSILEELDKLYDEEKVEKAKQAKGEVKEEPIEEGCAKKALKEDWYGADTEVEFDESVYGDIAKYFGLTENDKVYYAYYFLDEVTVNYTDAKGQDREIEKHVPIDQVEEWFKAGYYITEAAKKALKEADEFVVFEAESLSGENIKVAKKDLALAKRLDKKACRIWLKGENSSTDEDDLCNKYGITEWSGAELFDAIANRAGLKWDLADEEPLKEAVEESEEEIPEETIDTVEDFVKNFDEYDGKLKLEFKPIVIDGKEYPIKQLLWDDTLEEGKLVVEVIFDMPEEEPIEEEIPEEEVSEENLKGEELPEEDED